MDAAAPNIASSSRFRDPPALASERSVRLDPCPTRPPPHRSASPRPGAAAPATTAIRSSRSRSTLFNEQGYDATSVADLATRLGLTKSALYHHFDSKEQLLALALDEALSRLEGVFDEPDAREGSPAERLGAVLRGAVRVLVDRLPYVTLLLRVRGNSDIERAALERRRAFDHRVTALVVEAQQAGIVRDDIDGPVATRLIFGMVNSIVEWYRPGGPVDRERLAYDVVTMALDGMRTR